MDLAEAIRDVERAARMLAPEQGRIARRNARRRMLAALKAARIAMDAAFPAVRPEGRKRRKARTPAQQLTDLLKDGWVEVSSGEVATVARCAKQGIRAKVLEISSTGKPAAWDALALPTKVVTVKTLLPEWAYLIAKHYVDPKKLLAARKSQTVRDGLVATLNLKGVV